MRVYHLLPATHAIEDLQRKRLKVATFEDLNDPFELLSAKLPTKSLRVALRGFKRDIHARIGLLCFGPVWDNTVMWSHYADKHRGMCLGFDVTDDQYVIQVKYIAARSALKFQDDLESKGIDPAFAFDLMRSKYEGWSYEQELRMYVGLKEQDPESHLYFHDFEPDLTLKEVILGHGCPIPISKVKTLVGKSVQVMKARLAFNTFRVVPKLDAT